MFLHGIVRRRLVSLLQPWLREEPELELELGLINSRITSKNLKFDSSALNQLLDDPSRFSFKEVSVEELSVRFSNWSVPAFKIEVRGFNVTLLAGEEKKEGISIPARKSSVTIDEEKRKAVAGIDPEGSALHDVLQRILVSTPSRNRFTTSLLNLVLKHCHLQIFNTNLQVQVPILNDALVCLVELNEFNGESQYFEHGCFFRGFIGAVFNPLKETSIAMDFRGFGIGYEMKDMKNFFFPSTDLFSYIKLNDLQLADLSIRVPELSLLFSPLDLLVLSVFGNLPSKESKRARNGRHLWRLAANRLGYVISSPRLSLHNLVEFVCLWLRYLNAYEHLLSVLGYSAYNILKKSAIKMSRGNLSSVNHNWEVISRIEKELPAEAIAQARRIARFRATMNIQHGEVGHKESSTYSHFKVFSKILLVLTFTWKVIYRMVFSIVRGFLLVKFFLQEQKFDGHVDIISDNCSPQYCVLLNFGKISITLSPANATQNVTEKMKSHIGISHSDIHSFCLSIDAVLLEYVEEIFEQSLTISCGELKVKSSSVIGTTIMESNSKHHSSSVKGNPKRSVGNLKTVLWGEPAQIFFPSRSSETNDAGEAESAYSPLLKNFLGDMWSTWKRACTKYDDNEIEYSQNPWLLYEMKNNLVYLGQKSQDSGFWKCSLIVGKLNLTLGHLSMVSMAILLMQMQLALKWTADNERASVLLRPTPTLEDQLEISWEGKYEGFVGRIKMASLRMLPEKCIQLGVFITGPHIQMSMRKIGSNSGNKHMNYIVGQDDFHLRFDIHNIEAVVWPSSKSDLALSQLPGLDDTETECHRLREPQIIEIPKSDNEKYASQISVSLRSYLRINGLNIYMGDSTEMQQSQILLLKPIAVQLSFFRECVHSFSTTTIALSAALHGRASGFTVVSYMDELHAFFQVIADLFSAVSYAFDGFHVIGYIPLQDFMRRRKMFSETDNNDSAAEGAPLIYNSTLFKINGAFHLKSVDVILQNSRISDKGENSTKVTDALGYQKFSGYDLHDCGIWISVHHAGLDVSCEEGKVEILFDLLGIQSVIFRYQDHMGKSFDQFIVRNLQQQPNSLLYELYLSNFTFSLGLGCLHDRMSNSFGNSTLNGDAFASYIAEKFPLRTDSEISSAQRSIFENLGFASSISAPTSSHWILINVSASEIFIARHSIKNVVVGAQQFKKLTSLLSVGSNLQRIFWKIQGGHLFLETTALMTFTRCFSLCLHRFASLLSIVKASAKQVENAEHDALEILQATQESGWEMPEASTIDVSQFSLILVIEDDSGGFQEFVSELDVCVKLESANIQKKFMFELSRMTIFSQVLKERAENENQIPQFSSVISNESSSHFTASYPAVAFHHVEESHISHQNYILNHLVAFISAEKPKNGPLPLNQVWVGSGSVSGFDMTISLSEIRMLSSMFSSFSGGYNEETTSDLKQRSRSSNQEADSSLEDMVPNGAIVAIQDVQQHMYFAVDGENKYSLVGVIHYSFVGEKALFRVKHHKQKIWNSSVLWFSLISLHAKNDSGEPLRLNYHPGSGFVDISGTNDSGWSLWRALSCEPENYEGDVDWEPYNNLAKNKFYLINKKNDCAVAFIDGIPEFVRKPGNPFKFKLFQDQSLGHNITTSDGYSLEPSGANLHYRVQKEEGQTSHRSEKLPCIHIKIDNSNLTIVHELPDTKDRFPLLRGCIKNAQINVQILPYKTRVMNMSCALLYYFDAQRNSWRELVHPVEICTFYRANYQFPSLEIVQHGVPVHVYCRTKELDISLTELSLDILLFVIGELKLAGPFSVRNSLILANCCKVENQSSLNLICHFYDNKSVTIAAKQSASIFLRQPILASEPPEGASFVTIQLSDLVSFSTSSLHLSLSKTQTLAWRTRIVSLSDSRAYPGPFVVVDISRKSKDGLSIAISPLTRIHNGTKFSMELRFRRPQENEDVFASVLLKKGDSVDDSMTTFDAINLSGGLKKVLMSLSVGNFLFSFRPEITDDLNSKKVLSVEWSDELKGGKAVRLSGIFNMLSYKVRRALSFESTKCSFSTAHCTLQSEDARATNLHFLIQSIGRDVPIMHPDKSGDGFESRNSAVSLQEQKEIFLLPTVRVSNLLHSEIHVLLTETDLHSTFVNDNIGKQETIACGSTADFYVNPAMIYFTVTLTAFRSSCKPVNSGDWIKKLSKNKNDVHCLDIDLDFGGGKYFALLRLSRGFRGILEAAVFAPYSLRNNTDFYLFFFPPNQKPLSRDEVRMYGSSIPPELGLFCPPNSIKSWFLKSHRMQLKRLEDRASEVLLDLDALSGVSEISLETVEGSGLKYITKFGICIGPSSSVVEVPSQIVTLIPRHVVYNESEESVTIRQCYLEDGMACLIHINSKERTTLQLQNGISKSKEFSFFENMIRKHRNDIDTSSVYIQFQLNGSESGWSGPVCIASLGCFFLKFRKHSNQVQPLHNNATEFASVHVIEEGSTLGMHFYKPPNVKLPYRIENHLRASLTYYQKDSSEQEVLGSESSAYYVWDDLILPHKLVVVINDMHLLREINLDKVRPWKPFHKLKQNRGLASLSFFNKKSRDQKSYFGQLSSMEIVKVGYEVYAEGPTRVLRICEFSSSQKGDRLVQSCAKIQLRVVHFAIHLLEDGKQDFDKNEEPCYTPFVVTRLGNINLNSIFTDQHKYNQISLQSLNIDEKWIGAPFAAMLRRHQLDSSDSNVSVLKVVFILLSNNSNVRQVKYSSVILQPIDLNLDEETLIRLASFWRTSLSDSSGPSQQYYFDHFEVHPIKIIANFLPGDSYSSYDSAQETLRSLLHSVVKVPPVKNMVVELNGVLVTHALITMRELFIRCARHYSWYAMRAIYIAKGSPLLPPAFASMFDDLASSSLDVFFDPSRGLLNLPGFTLGTFKFISKCIGGKGFSGTKRYFGDLEKTLRTVGSNVLFAAVTEITDSVLKGAETSGFDGVVRGFHQGILKLAMEPSLLGTALMEGGPDRKIKLDRSPGIDELYIEGYLQAMLDTMYRQEYLRVRVIDDQVFLKNLPPNSALIDEIMDRVKGFLVSKALLKGDFSASSRSLRHLRGESEWKIGPTLITLCEHLFVSFAIRMLRKQTGKLMANIKWKKESETDDDKVRVHPDATEKEQGVKFTWKWDIGKFVFSGILAYIDGRLCRGIPNPIARRIVSGYLLSFIDRNDTE